MPFIECKFAGKCRTCGAPHDKGARVWWVSGVKGVRCAECHRTKVDDAALPRERPGAQNRSLPVDVLARELPDRALLMHRGKPRPGDTPELLLADLVAVLAEYDLRLRPQVDG
jgi:hypothetical protein